MSNRRFPAGATFGFQEPVRLRAFSDTPANSPKTALRNGRLPEADRLRARGRRLAEYVRLAIGESVRGSKEVLVHLFSFATIYAWRVMHYDDFVITVNPRHAPYYKRLLGFELLGAERVCPKVKNAPAVLMRLSRDYMDQRISESAGRLVRSKSDRSLYPYFYAPEAEPFIASFLKHRHSPMTPEEAEELGLRAAATAQEVGGRT